MSGSGPDEGEVHGGEDSGAEELPENGYTSRHFRTSPLALVLIVVIVLLALGGTVFALWYHSVADPGARGPEVVVEVSSGSSVGQITEQLERKRVLDSELAFRIYMDVSGAPVVEPGDYLLYQHQSFSSVKSTLSAGPDVAEVTVRAGWTVSELEQEVADVDGGRTPAFSSAVESGTVRSPFEPPGSDSLEGLLAVGNYFLLPDESDEQLLSQMISRFDTEADQAGIASAASALGLSPYQAIIVASIDQKEGVYPQNLGKVARVILNRLAVGMKLQMDSTVLYAEGRDGGTVTAQDEEVQSPYNTYLNYGLTPTPTCFPAIAALDAALHPTPGDWIYLELVSKDGTEAFSQTLAGQDANEALAQSRGLP